MYIVEHDNGIKGQRGCSEYTYGEIAERYGDCRGLIMAYLAAGITVHAIHKM